MVTLKGLFAESSGDTSLESIRRESRDTHSYGVSGSLLN